MLDKKDIEEHIRLFVNDRALMRVLRHRIINSYGISPEDAQSLCFNVLLQTVGWWVPGRASFATAVFRTMPTTCMNYLREKKRDDRMESLDVFDDPIDDVDAARQLHFKDILQKVIDRIQEVEDEKNRDILMNALIYQQPYTQLDDPTVARKMVSRFKRQLRKEFGDDLEW